MTKTKILSVLFAAPFALGCQFMARAPEQYKADTDKVIESKQADLKKCYDEVLKKDKKAAGKVVVTFMVAPETGEFQNVAVDPEQSTAPAALGECVATVLTGLKLDPPDRREGVVSWSYDFQANPPKQL